MIWKASTVLSLALCVVSLPRDRRPTVADKKIELNFPGPQKDLSHFVQQKPENHEGYVWTYPSYEFSYKVDDPKTHDKKEQHEVRDGGDVTGNYWLIQPDGEKRYIKYHVDDESGFTAVINYTSPHASVYYNVMKHRENNNKPEEKKEERKGKEPKKNKDETKGEVKKEEEKKVEVKKEEKNTEPKQATRQDSKKEEDKKDEKKKSGEGKEIKKGKEEEVLDRKGNNDKRWREKSRRDGDNWDWDWVHENYRDEEKIHHKKTTHSKPDAKHDGDHNKGEELTDELNASQEDKEKERGGKKEESNNQKLLEKKQTIEDKDNKQKSPKNIVNEKELNKSPDGLKDEDLWAGIRSWTIVHDRPQGHKNQIWEWDMHHDRSWPEPHSWNHEQGQGNKQDETKKNDKEKHKRGDNKPKSDKKENIVGDIKDRQVGDNDKQIGGKIKPKKVEEEKERGEERKEREEQMWERKEERRANRPSDKDNRRRGVENRRREGEQRRGGERRREDTTKQGREEQRDEKNREQGDRRGYHSYIHYTPIAYARRY